MQNAWALRLDNQREKCEIAFQQLRSALPLLLFPTDSLPFEKIFSDENTQSYQDALALQLSLLRLEERTESYQRLLTGIQEQLEAHTCPQSFWLLFESGVHFLRFGDHLKAIEYFGLANMRSKNSYEKLVCESNLLACRCNLNLPIDEKMECIESLLPLIPAHLPVTNIRSQYEVVLCFKNLHHGKIEDVAGFQSCNSNKNNPVYYLKAFTLALPYHMENENFDKVRDYFITHITQAYQFGYRSRTLLGILHPDDESPSNLSQWADRFYLWVWRWLINPEEFSLERVSALLAPLHQRRDLYRLTHADQQMIRNGLLWMSLFDSSSRTNIASLLKLFSSRKAEDYPLFALEKLIIHYFLALRDGHKEVAADYLQAIRMHSLYSNKVFLFSSLLGDNETAASFAILSQNLKNIVSRFELKPHPIRVDSGSYQILNNTINKKIVSEPMTRAVTLLKRVENISIEEFVAHCFGISRYDSTVHQGKVFNLISRLKPVLAPYLTLKVKAGRIYSEGDWTQVFVPDIEVNSIAVFSNSRWRDLVYQERVQLKEPVRRSDNIESILTREQLEKYTGKSRATVGRLLSCWEKKGLIERMGKAKATQYLLSDFLFNQIREGRITA